MTVMVNLQQLITLRLMTLIKKTFRITTLLFLLIVIGIQHSYAQEDSVDEKLSSSPSSKSIYTTNHYFPNIAEINLTAMEEYYKNAAVNTDSIYSDIPANHHYYPALIWLNQNQIITGYSDGTFKPFQKVNRAELTKMIVSLLKKNQTEQNCFSDVSNEWFASYVCSAKSMNIIKGYSDNTFRPEQTIIFSELAEIITNAFTLKQEGSVFENSPWYKEGIIALEEKKAIPAIVSSIDEEVNRLTAAEILWRVAENTDTKTTNTYLYLKGNDQPESIENDYIAIQAEIELFNLHIDPLYVPPGVSPRTNQEILAISHNITRRIYSSEHASIYLSSSFPSIKTHKELVFRLDINGETTVYPTVDSETLQIIDSINDIERNLVGVFDNNYNPKNVSFIVKDKNSVYQLKQTGTLIYNQVDLETFTKLDEATSQGSSVALKFFKDKYTVFVNIKNDIYPIKSADPLTFERIRLNDKNGRVSNDNRFFKDKDTIFFHNKTFQTINFVTDIDLESLKVISYNLYEDKNAQWGVNKDTGNLEKLRDLPSL